MQSDVTNLINAVECLLEELDEYETRQLDENEEFGPTTCVGRVREAIKQLRAPSPSGAKKIYYVSFTFTETGHPYFDTISITDAEASRIREWLAKREAADLITKPEVSSLDKLPDYDSIMENLSENDMLALDEDEDTETVSSVENVSDLAERFDEKNGTPEQDEAESD